MMLMKEVRRQSDDLIWATRLYRGGQAKDLSSHPRKVSHSRMHDNFTRTGGKSRSSRTSGRSWRRAVDGPTRSGERTDSDQMGALTVISLLPFLLILPPAFKELFLGSNIGGIFHELIALSEIELHSSILVPFLLHITIEDELFASNLKFRHVLLVGHFGVRTGKIFIVRSLSSNLEALDLSLEIIVVCPFGVELLRGVLCLL